MGRNQGGGVTEAFGVPAALVRQPRLPQALQLPVLLGWGKPGLEQEELVAAYPAYLPAQGLQRPGDLDQIAVALLMPKGIVTVFQIVHIDKGERKGSPLLQPLLHLFGGIAPVVQVGQRVYIGIAVDQLLPPLPLRLVDHDMDDGLFPGIVGILPV